MQTTNNHSGLTAWFMENVVYEITIVGDFFKEDRSTAIYKGGKCVFMLIGGTTAMMSFGQAYDYDSMQMRVAKMAGSMAVGGTLGKITFNLGCELGKRILYGWNKFRQSSNAQMQPSELQALAHSDISELSSLNARALNLVCDV